MILTMQLFNFNDVIESSFKNLMSIFRLQYNSHLRHFKEKDPKIQLFYVWFLKNLWENAKEIK